MQRNTSARAAIGCLALVLSASPVAIDFDGWAIAAMPARAAGDGGGGAGEGADTGAAGVDVGKGVVAGAEGGAGAADAGPGGPAGDPGPTSGDGAEAPRAVEPASHSADPDEFNWPSEGEASPGTADPRLEGEPADSTDADAAGAPRSASRAGARRETIREIQLGKVQDARVERIITRILSPRRRSARSDAAMEELSPALERPDSLAAGAAIPFPKPKPPEPRRHAAAYAKPASEPNDATARNSEGPADAAPVDDTVKAIADEVWRLSGDASSPRAAQPAPAKPVAALDGIRASSRESSVGVPGWIRDLPATTGLMLLVGLGVIVSFAIGAIGSRHFCCYEGEAGSGWRDRAGGGSPNP
jgi:hypothetical protein